MNPFLLLCVGPSLFVLLAVRRWVARRLGMVGLHFFGGTVENVEAATPGKRAAVVLAGLASSYLVAGVVFAIALLAGGKQEWSTEIGVIPDKPAALAGMRSGDRVVEIGGKPVARWDELSAAIGARAGEPTVIVARRDGEEVRFTVTPDGTPGHGKIGVTAVERRVPPSAADVIDGMLAQPARVIRDVAVGIARFAAGSPEVEAAGPAAIVKHASRAARTGVGDVLYMCAVFLAYAWPITALVAIALVPRRRRPSRARGG